MVYPLPALCQDLQFDASQQQAYKDALSLRCDDALERTSNHHSAGSEYIASLTEAIELLITEDYTKFSRYEERFQKRLARKHRDAPVDVRFLQAEIRLHWAFVYFKFGHELDAALQFREAYQLSVACREEFPEYLPIRKTTGILQIIVGSIPDKYNWILSLLNMRGSVSEGLADLTLLSNSQSPLALEAKLLNSLVKGFVLSEPSAALLDVQEILRQEGQNPLALFLGASLALKSSENDLALRMLNDVSEYNRGIPLHYADYLKGEAYLNKGNYLNSISSYRCFINHQAGQNYIKDAWYKIGLCYWLNGNEEHARAAFEEAERKGKEATEADKSAGRRLAQQEMPNIKLSRARHFTDGGYLSEAEEVLAGISESDLPNRKDQVEYYYRKARLAHKMGMPDAMDLYLQTIEMAGQETWYFAPNACLQLGYIYQSRQRMTEAAEYFHRALSYRRHEYKNSIDAKARSALAQLGRM